MKGDRPISVFWLWQGKSITKNTAYTSDSIDLSTVAQGASFSLWWTIGGNGEMKFEYLVSPNGHDFLEPSGASDIASSLEDSDGTTGHWISAGDYLLISGVAGMVEINNLYGLVASVVANTSATVGIASTAFTTYTSGGLAWPCTSDGKILAGRIPMAIQGISKAASAVLSIAAGNDLVSFSPIVAPYMKIRATETGTSADAVISAALVVQ